MISEGTADNGNGRTFWAQISVVTVGKVKMNREQSQIWSTEIDPRRPEQTFVYSDQDEVMCCINRVSE